MRLEIFCVALPLVIVPMGCSCEGVRLTAVAGEFAVLDGEVPSENTALDFGAVLPNQIVEREVVLCNLGSASISLDEVKMVSGDGQIRGDIPDDESPFAVKFPDRSTIEAGAQTKIIVRFRASSERGPSEFQAVARLTSAGASAGKGEVRLFLSARVLACPTPVPFEFDFGPTLIGQHASMSVRLSNPAPYPVVLRADPLAPEDAAHLSLGLPSPITMPPNGTTEVAVDFHPQAAMHLDTIAAFEVGTCPAPLRLRGEGVTRIIDWEPKTVDCGWVPLGQATVRTISLTALRRARVRDARIDVAPGNSSSEFSVPVEWSSDVVLSPGETVSRTVVCAPSRLGQRNATLTFSTDVPGQETGAVSLAAMGGGPEIALSPTSISFGPIALAGGAGISRTKALRISNKGTTPAGEQLAAALRLGKESAPGIYGAPYYRIETNSPSTSPDEFLIGLPASESWLVPGGWIDATVRLTPRSAGQKSATLVLFSNDPMHPEARVPLEAQTIAMPACQYEVVTPELDFGIVHATSPRTLDFLIKNTGTSADQKCLFSDPRIDGDASEFSLVSPFDTKLAGPGETIRLAVRFAPRAPPADVAVPLTGTIHLNVSSPSRPSIRGTLAAALGPACVVLLPSKVEFGTIPPGQQSVERSIEFANTCNEPVIVRSVTLVEPDAAFGLHLLATIPPTGLTLEPFRPLLNAPPSTYYLPSLFGARFMPRIVGKFQGRIVVDVERDAQQLRYVVPLVGAADVAGLTESDYVQGGGDQVDILLNIGTADRTPQGALEAQTDVFATMLQRSGNDFHLGVISDLGDITTPQGAARIGALHTNPDSPELFLTSSTLDLAAQLSTKMLSADYMNPDLWMVNFNAGADLALWRALTPSMLSGMNAGFRRPGARLVMLSAAASINHYTELPPPYNLPFGNNPGNIGAVAQAFIEAAGPPYSERLSFACLVAFAFSTCPDLMYPYLGHLPSQAVLIPELMQARIYAELLGGSVGEYCPADAPVWQKRAELLAETATGMRVRFPLQTAPDLSSSHIDVLVDGVSVAAVDQNGERIWSYESGDNVVRFEISKAPLPGSHIRLRYRTLAQ